jgi:hypothetical protein
LDLHEAGFLSGLFLFSTASALQSLSHQHLTMKKHDYDQLCGTAQLELVRNRGSFLAERFQYNLHIRLYQLFDFYVEVFSFSEEEKVVRIDAFEETDLLEPYLVFIDLSPLPLAS